MEQSRGGAPDSLPSSPVAPRTQAAAQVASLRLSRICSGASEACLGAFYSVINYHEHCHDLGAACWPTLEKRQALRQGLYMLGIDEYYKDFLLSLIHTFCYEHVDFALYILVVCAGAR